MANRNHGNTGPGQQCFELFAGETLVCWLGVIAGIKGTIAGHAARPQRLRFHIHIPFQLILPITNTIVAYSGQLLCIAQVEAEQEAGVALYCPDRRVHENQLKLK